MKGNFDLRTARSNGIFGLLGSIIEGDLRCAGATFANAEGVALSADSLHVTGSVFLNDGFQAEGEVRLLNAEIAGTLSCEGGAFENDGDALSADFLQVGY